MADPDNFDDLGALDEIDPENFLPNAISEYMSESEFNTMISSKPHLNNSFSLFFLNIRSLSPKLDALSSYLSGLSIQFTVIGFAETWLNQSNNDLVDLSGYSSCHNVRSTQQGGGVGLYVNDSITFSPIHGLNIMKPAFESVFIQITKIPNSSLQPRVGVIYRPPNADLPSFMEHLHVVLGVLQNDLKVTYILGDFNINLLAYETHHHVRDFIDLMRSQSYFPLISEPTRKTPSSATLIDNIFTNVINQNHKSGILYSDLSDHLPIWACNEYVLNCNVNRLVKFRSFSDQNIARFHERLFITSWDDILSLTDCQAAFTRFYNRLQDCFLTSFPLQIKKLFGYRNQPWVTNTLKKAINRKNKLYRRFLQRPTVFNEIVYKVAKSQVTRDIKATKRAYYHEQLLRNKGKMKEMWKILKSVIGCKDKNTNCHEVVIDDEPISEPNLVSNHFNDFFVEIGDKLASSIDPTDTSPLSYLGRPLAQSIFLTPVTSDELRNCVASLKNSSPGHDGIRAEVLKKSLHLVAVPLLHILNLSFSTGVFPRELKLANVTPVFKTGDSRVIGNYRPISILSVFSKILEKVMYARLYDFLTEHDTLYCKQFGFRNGFSTEMALLSATNFITKSLDDKKHVVAVFLDMRKAFDTVNLDILLLKLFHLGIRGPAHKWFSEFLIGRKQRVVINGVSSGLRDMVCGVPQGSTLGPLLFLLYINDLPNALSDVTPIIFADDTSLFMGGTDVNAMVENFNSQLSRVHVWLRANRLNLNLTKTHSMLFSLNSQIHSGPLHLTVDGALVERVSSTKYLGVLIDDHLTWALHINNISCKLSKSIGILNRVKHFLNRETMLMLYYAFIFPYLTYCFLVWGKAAYVHLQKLTVLQKRAVRVITMSHFMAHTDPLYKELKIVHADDLYRYLCSIFIYKSLKSLFPRDFLAHFNPFSPDSLSRNRINYICPFFRTSQGQKSLKFQSVKLYNDFLQPLGIVDACNSVFFFKKCLKSILC